MLACGALAAAEVAWASGNHPISVGAIVVAGGNCQFNAGAVDIAYRCTGGGTAPTIAWAVTGNGGLFKSTAPRPRNLAMPRSGAAPKNIDHTMSVADIVVATGFEDLLAGSDTDTVVLTIAP